jgi:hypothetical protein
LNLLGSIEALLDSYKRRLSAGYKSAARPATLPDDKKTTLLK